MPELSSKIVTALERPAKSFFFNPASKNIRRIVMMIFFIVPLLAAPLVARAGARALTSPQDFSDIIIQDQIMKNLIRKRAGETRRRNARARQQSAARAQQAQRRPAKAKKKAQT